MRRSSSGGSLPIVEESGVGRLIRNRSMPRESMAVGKIQ